MRGSKRFPNMLCYLLADALYLVCASTIVHGTLRIRQSKVKRFQQAWYARRHSYSRWGLRRVTVMAPSPPCPFQKAKALFGFVTTIDPSRKKTIQGYHSNQRSQMHLCWWSAYALSKLVMPPFLFDTSAETFQEPGLTSPQPIRHTLRTLMLTWSFRWPWKC